eukprot:6966090-Karenia_brevis.AAC.1
MTPLDASGKLPPTQYFPPHPSGPPVQCGPAVTQPAQSGSNLPPTQPYPIAPGQLPNHQPTHPGGPNLTHRVAAGTPGPPGDPNGPGTEPHSGNGG